MKDSTRIVLLGSTGSVGRQVLEVVAESDGRYEIAGLVAGTDAATLSEQAARFGVAVTGLGAEAAERLAASDDADIVVNAIVGAAGLRASVAALEAGKTLALANKESLVAAGAVCRAAAQRGGGRIVPVDSEHNAVAQCLRGIDVESVSKIVLTASGGPFRQRPDLSGVTVEEALAHPTWSMGPKITIDCATLLNKGLEVIEAHWLFDLPYSKIDVVVHPQSIVHGIVELRDGVTLMHAAPPDMKIPIASALAWPEVPRRDAPHVDLRSVPALEFEPVDDERFPLLAVARDAGEKGGTYPAVLNAANEVAVAAFLDGAIRFDEIAGIVRDVLAEHDATGDGSLDAVLEADRWAREAANGKKVRA